MRLVLCDDNRILCEALASVFEAHGHRVLAITTRAAEAFAAVSELRPDACLLDVCLPDGSGIDAARTMRQDWPDLKIVMLSGVSDPTVVAEARKAGVAGFLRKNQDLDSIVRAIEAVSTGGMAFCPAAPRQQGRRMTAECRDNRLGALTRREAEVLRRIVAGQSTAHMAGEMGIAISTLRGYVKAILAKLGAHSRIEAAAIANRSQYRSVA